MTISLVVWAGGLGVRGNDPDDEDDEEDSEPSRSRFLGLTGGPWLIECFCSGDEDRRSSSRILTCSLAASRSRFI